MAAVHFRHNLICWQGNFTKRGQSQRNSATNKSNVNQICSDFCCSLLKLVSLTFKTSKSARPTTQALCKGFVSLETIGGPSCSIPPFPNKSPQWHISILFKCFFHFLCFPLSYFSSAAVASLSHCLHFLGKTLRSWHFQAQRILFPCCLRRLRWVLGAFSNVYHGGQLRVTELAPSSNAAWHVVVLVHFSCLSLSCCGSNDKCWWLKPSRL